MFSSTDSSLLDAELEVLTSPYRRRVLLAVSDRSPLDETTLTAEAFARDDVSDDPDVLRMKLLHSHLPRLAKRGYIEWDPKAEVVRRGPNFADIEPLLGVVTGPDDGVSGDRP